MIAMGKSLRIALLVAMLLAIACVTGYAQPEDPPDPEVPITGIEILLALGGALGIKRILDIRRYKK